MAKEKLNNRTSKKVENVHVNYGIFSYYKEVTYKHLQPITQMASSTSQIKLLSLYQLCRVKVTCLVYFMLWITHKGNDEPHSNAREIKSYAS